MISILLLLLLLLCLALFQLFFYIVFSRCSLSFHLSDTFLQFIQIRAYILPFTLQLALLSLSYTQLHLESLYLSEDFIACFDIIPNLLTLLLQLLISMPQTNDLLFCLGDTIIQLILACRTHQDQPLL